MSRTPAQARILKFATYEVDRDSGELYKSGVRQKLTGQHFDILCLLLEHPHEVITRQDFQDRIWSKDTFVDYDLALRKAITHLRELLGDSAENPRFIETIPRKGYRFIAPVEFIEETKKEVCDPASNASVSNPAATPPVETSRTARWRRALRASGMPIHRLSVLVVCAALLAVWFRGPLPPPRILGSNQITNDGLPKGGLITDGNRIYFTENPSGENKVAQVSTRGGETAAVDVPFPLASVTDISREQSELLIYQGATNPRPEGFPRPDGFYSSVPVPAGPPRKLSDVLGHDAVWAPNGKLVFAKGNDFYIAGPDGSNPRKFATSPDLPSSISFSPDGTRFRFTVTDVPNHTWAIWEARPDGSDLHPLFPNWRSPHAECCGTWTPDGKYYVFQSYQDGASNIWVVREHFAWRTKVARTPVQLTTGPLQFYDPLPSKDGKKLFVVGMQQRAELVRYDAKSGEFVPFLNGISAGDIEVSRDGQWVTYVSYPDHTLWRSRLDGSARLQLTYPPLYAVLPHWSPDGQQIAISGSTLGMPWKVLLVSKDGGRTQAVSPDQSEERDATWSSDGKMLAFGLDGGGNGDKTFIELFNTETHQISELLGSRQIYAPRWSPDGHYIVGISYDASNKLMLYDVWGHTWRPLTTNLKGAAFGYLAWSADSVYLYFDAKVNGENAYFRVRISDSKVERLVDLNKIKQFIGVFGTPWTGLGPGNIPLFTRDISTQEIYALDVHLP
jgi:DNA-binding winged helix-turn-helix (wHTH) protein/Tol biopolymer transport system component